MSNLTTTNSDSSVIMVDKNAKRAKMVSKILVYWVPAAILAYFAFPYVKELLQNAVDITVLIVRLVVMIGVLAVLYFACSAFLPAVRLWFEKMAYRALDAVIANRPTETIHMEIAKAEKRRQDYIKGLADVKLTAKEMQELEAQQTKDAIEQLKTAKYFKDKGDLKNSTLAANEAQRKKQSNENRKPMLDKLLSYTARMDKLAEALDFFIEDKKSVCVQIEADWNAAKKMAKAMGAVQANLGMMEDDSIYARAVRITQEQIHNSMAFVESVMENSKGIIANAELKQGMLNQGGQELLGQLDDGSLDNMIELMNSQTSWEQLKAELADPTSAASLKASSQEQVVNDKYKSLYQ